MTDKQTTVSGTVRNARGEQIIDYTAVLFPAQLKEGVVVARYVRAVRPDQQGRYQTRGYTKRLTLTEGQTATIDLALAQ